MASPPVDGSTSPNAGLPPVQPPSARFISQLFVIPGLIIFVLVGLIVASMMLVERKHDPDHFLRQLDSENTDVRWRGLSDLAQILKRNEVAAQRWKSDPKFALELTDRLDGAFAELLKDEAKIASQVASSTDKNSELAWRKLRPQRDYVSFLGSALGEFYVPVGAPVLCKIARHDASADLKGNTLQRRKALWALMNMGENFRRMTHLPSEQTVNIRAVLQEESAKESPRAAFARTGLWYVDPTLLPSGADKNVSKVDETLVYCAAADDQFLRELVAMAFNFWDGPQAEATLLKLTHDNGRGTLIRVEEND